MLTLLATGCASEKEKEVEMAPSIWRVMFLGDSITLGTNQPNNDGFRAATQTEMTGAGIPFTISGPVQVMTGTLVNPWWRCAGFGSHTIAQLNALFPTFIGANPADMVLIHAGTVDVALGTRTLDQMLADLSDLIDTVSGGALRRRIVVAQIIPQTPPAGGNNNLIIAFNAAIPALVASKVAAGMRVKTADMYTGFDLAWINVDGVHPTDNAAGVFMGARWLPPIQAFVDEVSVTFAFQGYTDYGATWLLEGDEEGHLDAADVLAEVPLSSPIGRLFSQPVADDAEAVKILFGADLNGDHTIPPNQLGQLRLVGQSELARWDVTAHAHLGALRITVNALTEGDATAYLRVKALHTLVR